MTIWDFDEVILLFWKLVVDFSKPASLLWERKAGMGKRSVKRISEPNTFSNWQSGVQFDCFFKKGNFGFQHCPHLPILVDF